MATHTFDGGQRVEQQWAPALDTALCDAGYDVRAASMDEQWRGIDRIVTDEQGVSQRVEYKCCEKAEHTGNLFLETMSNAGSGRRGCVLTSEADWFLYFATPDRVFVFRMEALRAQMPDWRRRFPEKAAPNKWGGREYKTLGVCVPVAIAAPVAEYIARIDQRDGIFLQRRDEP